MTLVQPAAFLFLGASTPWVHALAAALAEEGYPTRAIGVLDWLTYRRTRPVWPTVAAKTLQHEWWVQAPGYAGRLARWHAPWLRWKLASAERALRRQAGRSGPPVWVVVPYPWFEAFTTGVPNKRLLYFHYDDYPLFRPERKATILAQQKRLVERAALTLCSSRQQTEVLRERYPTRAEQIRHFPHGVVESFINPAAGRPPQKQVVGYIGNLTDRVDWRLVSKVAEALPGTRFVFVGGLTGASGGGNRPDWLRERAEALARPNVAHIGPVPQEAVHEHYWQFDVFWIPYATDHMFNQASSPTKVMDGLAGGRPVLSTDLPECRLYPEWITVARDADEMAQFLHTVLAAQDEPARASRALKQIDFVRQQTWSHRARTLAQWLTNIDQSRVSDEAAVSPSTMNHV